MKTLILIASMAMAISAHASSDSKCLNKLARAVGATKTTLTGTMGTGMHLGQPCQVDIDLNGQDWLLKLTFGKDGVGYFNQVTHCEESNKHEGVRYTDYTQTSSSYGVQSVYVNTDSVTFVINQSVGDKNVGFGYECVVR